MKTLRNIVTIGGIILSSLLPMKKAQAQVNGSMEYLLSEHSENSYPRLNLFYGDIEKVKGFSFLELYKNQKGYFGKTTLEKQIIPRVNAAAQIKYAGEPLTSVGLGASVNVVKTNNNSFFNFQALPVWIPKGFKLNKDEFVNKKEVILGYSAKVNLPKDFFLFSFGQMNVNDKGGPTWCYGELTAGKKFKKWSVGYNPALVSKGQGKAVPKMEHRAYVSRDF